MAKQLLEINKFQNGTVTTPDASDIPEQSATYSLNLDCVNKDGALQGAPTNTTVTCRVTEDNDLVTATVDIDKARVIKSVDSSGNVSEDVVAWEDDSNKLHFLKNAQATNPTYDPADSLFNKDSDSQTDNGIQVQNTPLENVAMQVNNKEVHVGLGSTNKPKWIGYTNHKGLNESAKKLIIEDAEVKYPSSIPYMYKVVHAQNSDGYIYGIELGGTQIWKINGLTGEGVATSTLGTFNNLRSICTDGSGNLYVLDKEGEGKIYKVAVGDLDTKTETYTLGTYAGPSGSNYSDIEYTSTNTTLWLACHFDDKLGSGDPTDKLLFKVPATGTATVTPTVMMPNMSGGNKDTPGTWVDWEQESAGAYDVNSINPTSNHIKETFPRSLLKHPSDNDAIYWLARYSNSGNISSSSDYYITMWLNRDGDDLTGADNEAKVLSVSTAMTLALHRIKNNHSTGTNNSGGDFVPITSVYHPNNANGVATNNGQGVQPFTTCDITSIGIDNTDGEIYLTKGDAIQKLSTDLDETWTTSETSGNYNKYYLTAANATGPTAEILYNVTPSGQSPRTGVSCHFGWVPTTAAIGNTYSADGTNFAILRQTGTSGFDKLPKTFTSSSTMIHFRDNSLISLSPSDVGSTTSELLAGYTYFYKISMMYDGYQESNLSLETVIDAGTTTDTSIDITINDKNQIPDRASGIKIYRAENSASSATSPVSVYRLVKYLTFASGWADSGTTAKTQTMVDKGTKGASYEAESGLPETLLGTLPYYSLSAQLNNQHYIGNCTHSGYIDDASSYVFVSKVGKFDVFDWVVDFIKLPTVPTALQAFAGRIFAFDKTNTYRVRGGNDLYIEDIFEGVGCLNDDAIVSTDFGLFFADNNNIYQHNGQTAEPIGEAIVRGDSTYSWQNRDTSYYTRAMYDAKRRSVYFTFKAGSNYFAWAWNIPRKRWDLLSIGDTADTTQPKGYFLLDDNSINISNGTSIIKYLGHASTKRLWSWVSKDLTMGNDTQIKRIKDIIVSGRASNGTAKALKASHSTNGTTPGNTAVLTVQKTRESDISSSNFRKTINANAERLKIKVEPQAAGDECGAVSILFKTKRSPR